VGGHLKKSVPKSGALSRSWYASSSYDLNKFKIYFLIFLEQMIWDFLS
jgi:hypothetical protein